MTYAVNVAADVIGMKKNYILEFPYPPSFTELIARAESVLASVRGTSFVVTHMEVFEEETGEWCSVSSISDIHEGSQLYVFEPESWRTDTQQQIPPPVLPPMLTAAPTSAAAPPAVITATTTRLPTVGITQPHTPIVVAPSTAPRKHLILSPVDESQSALLGSPTPATALTSATTAVVPQRSVIPQMTTSATAPRHLDIRSSTTQSNVISVTPKPQLLRPDQYLPTSVMETSSIRPTESLLTNPLTAQSLYTDVTHDEKVRYTYEYLVNHYSGSLSMADWIASSKELGLPLHLNRIQDLFMKADANKDGIITEGEWARFTERYPALLQSVYYRIRDDEEMHVREIDLENAKIQLTVQQTTLKNKNQDLTESQVMVAQREQELNSRDVNINQLLQGQQVLESAHQNYLFEIEAAANLTTERERQMQEQVHRHNEVVQQVNDAVDSCDVRVKQHQSSKEALAMAENAFAISREQHDASVSSLEHTAANGESLYREYSTIRHDVAHSERSITEAIRGTAVRAENFSFLEERVSVLTAEHENFEKIFAKATSDLLICQRQAESERSQYQESLTETAALESELVEATSLGSHYSSTLKALEQDNAAYNNRRRLVEEQERPLVLEELQLRDTIISSEQKYSHSHSYSKILTAD